MESASNSTLLELVYDDGHPRIVEPYSLTFKSRKDGFGQEYFYAYDRTEGRTSGPGIKTFLHSKIRSITPTSVTFEPRLPVELSRAGEFGVKTYFGSTFGGTIRIPRISRSAGTSSRIYLVECSYCRKRFPRKKYSTRLRRHKDRYGNVCHGRSGFIAY